MSPARARRRTCSSCLLASALLVAPAEFEGAWSSQGRTLEGVIGRWADTTIGGPAFLVNGERWSGTTEAGALRDWSARLFGSASEPFVRNGSVPAAFPFAIAPGIASFTSGTLRVQFNLVGGASDQIAGLLFGLQPNGDYHYVRYNTRDGNLAVWRVRNGEREVLKHGEVHKQLPLRSWHELVVRIEGREVSGQVAGDTSISVHHTLDAAPAGRVGVWAKRDAITAFRQLTVTPSRP